MAQASYSALRASPLRGRPLGVIKDLRGSRVMHLSVIAAARGHETDAANEWAGGPFAEHDWLWKCLCGAPDTAPDFLFRRWDVEGAPRAFVLTTQKPLPQCDMWEITTRDYAPRL